MMTFIVIAVVCAGVFAVSFLAFDDIDLGQALDFGDDGHAGWFSLRSFLLFGVGFGAAGTIAMQNGWTAGWASVAGVGFGGVLYLLGAALAIMMTKQETNSLRSLGQLHGKVGVVVTEIKDGAGIGEVSVMAETHVAQGPGAGALPVGTRVQVIDHVGAMLIVAPLRQETT